MAPRAKKGSKKPTDTSTDVPDSLSPVPNEPVLNDPATTTKNGRPIRGTARKVNLDIIEALLATSDDEKKSDLDVKDDANFDSTELDCVHDIDAYDDDDDDDASDPVENRNVEARAVRGGRGRGRPSKASAQEDSKCGILFLIT
jgi:hypothetical protein